jgi:hypothetical protein
VHTAQSYTEKNHTAKAFHSLEAPKLILSMLRRQEVAMNTPRILSSHFFWQFLALLMPLLVVLGKFATYRPSHDPLDISITVLAQLMTWLLHALPAFLLAKGFKVFNSSSDVDGSGKSFIYLVSGIIVYAVGYVFWHRFWYRSIAALF